MKQEKLENLLNRIKNNDSDAMCDLALIFLNGEEIGQDKLKALELWEKAAKLNDSRAYYNLGVLYENGNIVKKDVKKAIKYFEKAIELDDKHVISSSELFNLGSKYENGEGVEKDIQKAISYYEKAAQLGNGSALDNLGVIYDNGEGVEKDIQKAISYYEKAAELNNNPALFNLGLIYNKGEGVKKDIQKAIYYYEKAAELGNGSALDNLGVIYNNGEGVKKDIQKAISYYKKAAELGNSTASYNLGCIYENGEGVEKDIQKAISYYEKAIELGYCLAFSNLGFIYENGEGVEKDIQKAISYYEKAAELNDNPALCNLGLIYNKGEGVEKDVKKSISYYEKAAELGNPNALYNLGVIYDNGDVIEKDIQKAISYYEKASELGHISASHNLALIYHTSEYYKNIGKAVELYLKCIKNNNASSMTNLGYIYEFGENGNIDLSKAFKYYEMAAKCGEPYGIGNLASLYLNKEFKGYNKEKSFYWFNKLAEENNPYGLYRVGVFYYLGEFESPNYEKAVHYFQKGADQNDQSCLSALGTCYEEGKGVSKDLKKALNYYILAKENGSEKDDDNIDRLKNILAKSFLHLVSRKDVFISWNHNDKEIKDELVNELEKNNICTVWDSDGSGVGNINEIINDAIVVAKSYIILLSGNSIGSEWVEKEVSMIFDVIDNHPDYINTILPIIINEKNIDGKKQYFNTLAAIKNLNENSVLKRVLKLSTLFPLNDNEIDYKSLIKVITKSIDTRLKIEYKYKIKEKYSTFNAALTKVVRNNNITSKLISATLDFNNCYINRPLYDINDNKFNCNELLNYKYSLIYGVGGSGKTLYLQNIIRNLFNDDNFILYIPCKQINQQFDNNVKFIEILKTVGFEYYYPDGYKISSDSFNSIFNNNVIILVDALDELNTDITKEFYASLEQFVSSYGNHNIKFIFTSRNISDSTIISEYVKNEVNTFELKGLNDDDINKIFDNISNNVKSRMEDNKDKVLSLPSKSEFFVSLKNISDDIRQNPLLLSNLIYVYIITRKIPDKQFTIIQKSNELLTNTLEEERDVSFKYYNYINGDKLNDILGYLSYQRSCNNNNDCITVFQKYFEKNNLLKNDDDSYIVSESIYNFLTRRSILIRDNIAHEIFRDYYTACYIFKRYFNTLETDWETYYLDFRDNFENAFNSLLTKKLSLNELPWPSISVDLLTKIDYEIFNFDTKALMNENNDSYSFFNNYLNKIFDDESGYSTLAKEAIKKLVDKKLLYFYDFIKAYFN